MLQRKTPLRADRSKTEEWHRRSRAKGKRTGGPLPKRSRKRSASIRTRAAVVIPVGPREPVEREDHAFRQWVCGLVCAVELAPTIERVEPAHFRCKARNGDWLADPDTGELCGNIMPLSHAEHAEQHRIGVDSFALSRGLDLDQLCAVIGQAYREGWTCFALSAAARAAGGYQHIDLSNPTVDPTIEAP